MVIPVLSLYVAASNMWLLQRQSNTHSSYIFFGGLPTGFGVGFASVRSMQAKLNVGGHAQILGTLGSVGGFDGVALVVVVAMQHLPQLSIFQHPLTQSSLPPPTIPQP